MNWVAITEIRHHLLSARDLANFLDEDALTLTRPALDAALAATMEAMEQVRHALREAGLD